MDINIYKSVYFTDAIIDKLPNLADKLSKAPVSRPSAERELQADSFLFRLPAEIRNLIYKLVLGHQTFQVKHQPKPQLVREQDGSVRLKGDLTELTWESWRTNDAVEWPRLYEKFRTECKYCWNSKTSTELFEKTMFGSKLESSSPYKLSLLRTCKRIYSETQDLPYITSTIKAVGHRPSPPLFMWRMTDYQARLITSLQLSLHSLNFADLVRIYSELPELRNLRIMWNQLRTDLPYPRGHAIIYCWHRLSGENGTTSGIVGYSRGSFITSMVHDHLKSVQVIFEARGLPLHLKNKDLSTCFEAILLAKGENAFVSLRERFAPDLTEDEVYHGGVPMRSQDGNAVQLVPS